MADVKAIINYNPFTCLPVRKPPTWSTNSCSLNSQAMVKSIYLLWFYIAIYLLYLSIRNLLQVVNTANPCSVHAPHLLASNYYLHRYKIEQPFSWKLELKMKLSTYKFRYPKMGVLSVIMFLKADNECSDYDCVHICELANKSE